MRFSNKTIYRWAKSNLAEEAREVFTYLDEIHAAGLAEELAAGGPDRRDSGDRPGAGGEK